MKDPTKQLQKVVASYDQLMRELREYDRVDSNAAMMTLPEKGILDKWYAEKDAESANSLADSLADEYSAGFDKIGGEV